MIRPRSLSDPKLWLIVGLSALGCARTTSPRFATATELESGPRRAAGVAVDPATELPSPSTRADSEQGAAVLRAPPDPEAARDVVKSFFRAVTQGSSSELEPLLREEAWVQAGAMTGRQRALSFWQMRLSRLDYTSLAGSTIYRDSDLETYRVSDLPKLRPPRTLAISGSADDVIVRVPISSPRSGKTRLFGDEIVFVLRPDGNKYAIVEMAEDFSLP